MPAEIINVNQCATLMLKSETATGRSATKQATTYWKE